MWTSHRAPYAIFFRNQLSKRHCSLVSTSVYLSGALSGHYVVVQSDQSQLSTFSFPVLWPIQSINLLVMNDHFHAFSILWKKRKYWEILKESTEKGKCLEIGTNIAHRIMTYKVFQLIISQIFINCLAFIQWVYVIFFLNEGMSFFICHAGLLNWTFKMSSFSLTFDIISAMH